MSAMDRVQLHRSAGAGGAGRAREGVPWVLVVDDELVVRDLLERFLALEGYRVMTAEDGLDAVRIFQSRPGMFEAVILDVLMPRMDGRDTFDALRRIDPALPVLIMSGFAPGERADQIIGQPGTAFIHKPFVLGDVLLRLQSLVAGRAASAAPAPIPVARRPRLEGITD
jgi:DNA-binding response OmpR family regulator